MPSLTATEKVFKKIQNNKGIALIIVSGTIILSVIGFIDKIADFMGAITRTEKIAFSDADFAHDANSRFAFSFDYPKTWDRTDPANSDGNTYICPKNDFVTLRVWGSWSGALMGDATTEEFLRQKAKYNLVSKRESGKNYYEWNEIDDDVVETREQIPGIRMVYEYFDTDRKVKMRALLIETTHNDRSVSLMCEAPANLYPSYEDLFLELGSRLRILKLPEFETILVTD